MTVIAAGFDGGEPPTRRSGGTTARLREEGSTGEVPAVVAPSARQLQQPRSIVFEDSDDDLDIPDFLK